MEAKQAMPEQFDNLDQVVDRIIERVGNDIVLGLPLGLGKSCTIANALFQRASSTPELKLTILTALTLEAPAATNLLAKRFLEPIADNIFGRYPGLDYTKAARAGTLPDNIQIKEFFLSPGKWLKVPSAQQNYISVNYSHAIDALIAAGMNVIAQIVAEDTNDKHDKPLSLSCNPDITVDLLNRRKQLPTPLLMVGEVHGKLPYMVGDAARENHDFDILFRPEDNGFELFKIPLEPVFLRDHAIGMQVAALVEDGGTLQIGIGAIGDAICFNLNRRHQHPHDFQRALRALQPQPMPLESTLERFDKGLYACTEMLVDGLLSLLETGVLKREVDGFAIHAGFFVGSPTFHQQLENLPVHLRHKIGMMPVSYTNTLSGQEQKKRRARTKARFVNSTMMMTLQGAAVSDGLDDGRVVSGVGGQHDFIQQAHQLPDARAILTLPATRTKGSDVHSNIVWSYGHTTIPRHLRDVVVTEYGIADLRHQTDEEVIKRMLAITDSRFQDELLAKAKAAGKIGKDYQLPKSQRHNTPHRLQQALRGFSKQLPKFPIGSTFTPTEQTIAAALAYLSPRASSKKVLLKLVWQGFNHKADDTTIAVLERLQLQQPKTMAERFYRRLVIGLLATENF